MVQACALLYTDGQTDGSTDIRTDAAKRQYNTAGNSRNNSDCALASIKAGKCAVKTLFNCQFKNVLKTFIKKS